MNKLITAYIPQSSDEYSNNERYNPTEEDILDSKQESFKNIIKPIENNIKLYLQQEIKSIITAKTRHYIHKNKHINNDKLYDFVISHINFNSLFNNIQFHSLETFNLINDNIISKKQLQYDFIQYIKYYFALYIKLLIEKYRNESILSYDQQIKDKNYNIDKYIQTPEQLTELIDEVGDTIQLDNGFNINYKCRDNAFIVVKNKAFIGDNHLNLMLKYLKNNNINDPYYFNIENIDKLKLPYAYGHIYQGRALINWYKYCTLNDIKNALLKEGKYYIYNYNTNKQTLYRLAKKV